MTMPRAYKRKQPRIYNPAKPKEPDKVHDRRATDLNKGLAGHVAPIEIDDPFEAGSKLIAMRNIRNDPLARMHTRKQIDEGQFHGGRLYQRDFETIERGPQAVDPSKPYVDCSRIETDRASDQFSRALVRLNAAHRDLGQNGASLLRSLLIESLSIDDIAEQRSLTDALEYKYLWRRVLECLDTLAFVYGVATENSTKRRIS